MAIRYRKACLACDIILAEKGDKGEATSQMYRLVDQFHLKVTSLTYITGLYEGKISYQSLQNHAAKHQHTNKKKLIRKRLTDVRQKANEEAVKEVKHHTQRRTDLLVWLEEQVENGNVKPTLAGITTLLKQEAEIEEKAKDRTFEWMKLINAAASGAFDVKEIDGKTKLPGPDSGDQPRLP